MRKHLALLTIAFLVSGGVANADEAMIKGKITKVDEAQGKISIDHGPIKKFDMDAMTMVFRAGDPDMLKAVKPGDKVQFHVDKVNGQFTVTKIEKSK